VAFRADWQGRNSIVWLAGLMSKRRTQDKYMADGQGIAEDKYEPG
jgi:hypothetical protein